jgi:hypothetical protein
MFTSEGLNDGVRAFPDLRRSMLTVSSFASRDRSMP